MTKAIRGIAFFLITFAIGEVVRRILMSRPGEAASDRLGRPELSSYEGASAASKEVKKAIGFVRSLATGRESKEVKPVEAVRATGWIGIARDASEMLLAAGAVLKTVSDFVQEDTKLRRRVNRYKTTS